MINQSLIATTRNCAVTRGKSIPWIEPGGARDQAERTSDVGCVERRPLPLKAVLPSPPRHRSSALLGFGAKLAMDGESGPSRSGTARPAGRRPLGQARDGCVDWERWCFVAVPSTHESCAQDSGNAGVGEL
jgi:hypothetical protein